MALIDERREVPDRIAAAGVEDRDRRSPLQALVALLLGRPAEQHQLHVALPAEARHELDVAVLAPLFERPALAGAGVETDDRPLQVEAERGEMLSRARLLVSLELQHVTV